MSRRNLMDFDMLNDLIKFEIKLGESASIPQLIQVLSDQFISENSSYNSYPISDKSKTVPDNTKAP